MRKARFRLEHMSKIVFIGFHGCGYLFQRNRLIIMFVDIISDFIGKREYFLLADDAVRFDDMACFDDNGFRQIIYEFRQKLYRGKL